MGRFFDRAFFVTYIPLAAPSERFHAVMVWFSDCPLSQHQSETSEPPLKNALDGHCAWFSLHELLPARMVKRPSAFG